MTSLAQYGAARAALAAATRIDEILPLRAQMEHLKLYAKQVQDKVLLAEAADIQIRAEAKLGQLLIEAEKSGHIRQGRPRKPDPENPTSSEGFTLKEIGVSHRLSADSQQKASISEAALEAMIAGVRQRILNGRGKIIEEVDAADQKKQAREQREKILGGIQLSLPDKKFGVILADPEWRFKTYSRDTGMDRAADNHYPTSETDAICARPVGDIAADDCVLFLWATAPMLPDALRVMAAWGFDYKSHAIWKKDRIGTGYWLRNQHELLLIGTRGKIPAPAMGTQAASVIDAPIGEHSQKPACFYELIEGYFPTLPKIELNARAVRDGWDAWGLEAPAELPAHDPLTGEILEAPAETAAPETAAPEAPVWSPAEDPPALKMAPETAEPARFLSEIKCVRGSISKCDDLEACGARGDCKFYPFAPKKPAPQLSEFQQFKAFSDFCFPNRVAVLTAIAPDHIARGLAYKLGGRDDWGLTEAGWKRFHELDAERKAQLAAALEDPPEIVDGAVQCRMPLDDLDAQQQAAMKAIDAGDDGKSIDSELLRHLVGIDYLHAATDRLVVTERGRAFLDSMVDLAPAEQPPLDLPLFLAARP